MQREQRKVEHIKCALELEDGPQSTCLEELCLLHNCLPEINPADIDLSVEIFGKRLRLPFFIDAITGSSDAVIEINRQLAQVAQIAGIGLAVGSQYGAVNNNIGLASYEVIREENPNGIVLANLNAHATPEQAQIAVKMLHADALEIHLNVAQELWMSEGDKNYNGLLENMRRIKNYLTVPIIVKETGCGIGLEQYKLLSDLGFSNYDCAGAGGTNFLAIEAKRSNIQLDKDFLTWGIPTCWSLLDAQILPPNNVLIASGGIRTSLDIAKAFALGADAVAITNPVLKILVSNGVNLAISYLENLASDLKKFMSLLGVLNPYSLRKIPIIVSGSTRNYIDCRGYNLRQICKIRRS